MTFRRTSSVKLELGALLPAQQLDNNHQSQGGGTASVNISQVSLSRVHELFEYPINVERLKTRIRHSLVEKMMALGGEIRFLDNIENGTILAEHIRIEEQSLKVEEGKNIAFLWSCFYGRNDLLEPLRKIGAKPLSTVPDEDLFNEGTALHLAALSGCAASFECLISNGLKLDVFWMGLSPLHCAVLVNSFDCTRLLLERGATLNNTILHCAVEANAIDCLKHLLKKEADKESVDEKGWTALHVAADLGMEKCLQFMMTHQQKPDLNIQTASTLSTPLHLAVAKDNISCCQMLICANVYAGDNMNETALHSAAEAQNTNCLEVLLNVGCNVNAQDNDVSTPLPNTSSGLDNPGSSAHNTMETHTNKVAKINVRDKDGHTPLHVAAKRHASHCSTSQCVDILIMHGADVTARNPKGSSTLSIINQYCPESIKTIYRKLDSCVSMSDYENSGNEPKLTMNFNYLMKNSPAGEMEFLKTLESNAQEQLIEHPICKAFLHLKWQKIRKFYFGYLFLHLLFLILFTTYVIYALAHECYNAANSITTEACKICLKDVSVLINNIRNISTEPYKTCLENFTVVNNQTEKTSTAVHQIRIKHSSIGFFLIEHPLVIESTWYLLAFMAICETARKLLAIRGRGSIKLYFSQSSNVTEWFVILSVFLVSHVWYRRTLDWQKHLGGVMVLVAWIEYMIMVGQMPIFGIYVSMFTRVQTEFFKLLIAYSCLLIGFTASFCVLFPSNTPYQNPLIGFVKMLVMMTGELDFGKFEENLESLNPPLYSLSAYITFTLLIIFVVIVLMNLLVGIAVNDIKSLYKTAGLSKLRLRIKLIYFLQLDIERSFLPNPIMEHLLDSMALEEPVLCDTLLNLREKKLLPEDIIKAALNLIERKKTRTNSGYCWSNTPRNGADRISHQDEENSNEELQQLKEDVETQKASISNNLSKDRFVVAEEKLYSKLHQLKEMVEAQTALINELMKKKL